ncbi:MAG: sigma-70 family RNA polymerase sigma factor [Planctomycetota bacterium]
MSDVHDPDFYLAHEGYVRALARRLVYDRHAADDLFQAAWLAALQRPPRDGSTPRRWLARIVRNLATKAWLGARRRQQRELQSTAPAESSTPDAVLAHEQERRRLVDALLALDEPLRATLIARFFDGLSVEQIAARDGVPVETVRTRQKRGLQRLRERMLPSGASAVALVHGLQLGAPAAPTVLARLVHGAILMNGKNLLLLVSVLLLASTAWLLSPARLPERGEATSSPAALATAPVDEQAPSSTVVPVVPVDPERSRAPVAGASATAATTGSLAVLVQWADHRPATDIAVRVGFAAAANYEAAVVLGRSGRDGRVRFDGLPAGEAWIECDRGAQTASTIEPGRVGDAVLTIAAGVRIRGYVRESDGRPAQGAQVHLLCRHEAFAGHVVAQADAAGAFVVDNAPAERTLLLSALAPDHVPTPQQVLLARAGETVECELQFTARGGALGGRVVDEHGEPVVSAMVLLGPESAFELAHAKDAGVGTLPPLRSRRATTDARGEWRLDGVEPGDADVLIMSPRLAPWSGRGFVVAGAFTRCDAVLTPAVQLQGTVRDEKGAALVGATVRVARSPVETWTTRSDTAGAFALDGLPTMAFEAMATAEGAGQARTTLAGGPGATLRWDPVLVRATTLRGRVVAANAPVAEARVEARCMSAAQRPWFADATTDADGRFEITNCPEGLLHLDVRTATSAHFTVCKRDDVDPSGGEVLLEVDAARLPSAFVVGRVLAADGAPIEGADVSVLTSDYEWGGGHALRSGPDGRFRSPPVPPGLWFLTVRRNGLAQLSAPARALAASATEDFGDLVLTTGSTLVVTLQADAGLDLDGCVVGIADAVTGLASERPQQGTVRFPRLGAGVYTITVYAPGVALRPRSVQVGAGPETELVLRLLAGSEVTLDVRDEQGLAITDRLETELFDGDGQRIDVSPLVPGGGPVLWVRRLVADRYELRLRDHRGRSATVAFVVAADGAAVQRTVRFP